MENLLKEVLKLMNDYSKRHDCQVELTLKLKGNGYVGDPSNPFLMFEFSSVDELIHKLKE